MTSPATKKIVHEQAQTLENPVSLLLEEEGEFLIITIEAVSRFVILATYFMETPRMKIVELTQTPPPGSSRSTRAFRMPLEEIKNPQNYSKTLCLGGFATERQASITCRALPTTYETFTYERNHVTAIFYIQADNKLTIVNLQPNDCWLFYAESKYAPQNPFGKHTIKVPKEDMVHFAIPEGRHYATSYFIYCSTAKPESISYNNLSGEMREAFVPDCLIDGISRAKSIRNSTPLDWTHYSECLYEGTLTLKNSDKDFIMADSQGYTYKYTADQMRVLIPKMVRGCITGTFRYVPRGGINVTYALVPYETRQSTTRVVLCMSDDSDSDTEDIAEAEASDVSEASEVSVSETESTIST